MKRRVIDQAIWDQVTKENSDLKIRVEELDREVKAWREEFPHLHFVPDQDEPDKGYTVRND